MADSSDTTPGEPAPDLGPTLQGKAELRRRKPWAWEFRQGGQSVATMVRQTWKRWEIGFADGHTWSYHGWRRLPRDSWSKEGGYRAEIDDENGVPVLWAESDAGDITGFLEGPGFSYRLESATPYRRLRTVQVTQTRKRTLDELRAKFYADPEPRSLVLATIERKNGGTFDVDATRPVPILVVLFTCNVMRKDVPQAGGAAGGDVGG